ncbi:MAG: choice-of-anchor D domain-containing protein [Candidatus Rokubacteria bacterium]|nr:choice-of-anchor D domain-containing protein [Candidatus Rokubacteria bacterium]
MEVFDLTQDPPVSLGQIGFSTKTESVCITLDSRFAVAVDGSLATEVQSIDIAAVVTVTTLSMGTINGCVISDRTLPLGYFTVVVTDYNANVFRILHLDATTGVLTDPGISVANPSGGLLGAIAISPRGRGLAIATNRDSDDVTVLGIDGSGTLTVVGTIPTGDFPSALAIAPNGETAWIVNHGDFATTDNIAKLAIDPSDVVTDTGVRISIPGGPPDSFFGASGIAVMADSTRALVSDHSNDLVQELDLLNGVFTGVTIAVGDGPAQIGLPLPTQTAPAAPTGLTASGAPGTQVSLAWTDASGNETAFEIERDEGGGFALLSTAGAGIETFQDATVTVNRTYSYRVRAVNEAGASDYSNIATVTVFAGKLVVLPVRMTFFRTSIGDFQTQTVIVQNVGQGTLTGSVAGSLSAPFSLVGGDGALSLAPGETRTVTIGFQPSARGTFRSFLTITSSDPARSTTRVQLQGIVR